MSIHLRVSNVYVLFVMTALVETNTKTSIFRQDIIMYISAYVLMHTVP